MADKLKDTLLKREGPKIGPFKGRLIDARDKGSVIRPDIRGSVGVDVESRDIPSLQQLLSMAERTGMMPSMIDAVGGPIEAVAGVAPDAIKALKDEGLARLLKTRAAGLEERSVGGRPMTTEGLNKWLSMPWQERVGKQPPEEFYYPNHPLTPEFDEALTIAQERWPRLFGHIRDIADVDALVKLKLLGKKVAGGAMEAGRKTPKFSKLALSMEDPDRPANTVGHELLHIADRIAMGPEATKHYEFSGKLPGGYGAQAMEIRARNMGDRMEEIVKAARAAGGPGVRARTGRNVRVPLTGNYAPSRPTTAETVQPETKQSIIDKLARMFGFSD